MPESVEEQIQRLFGGGGSGGSTAAESPDQQIQRLFGGEAPASAPATPTLRPIDHEVADQLEGGRYAKPGISWMDRDNARAELSGSSNPDAWTGEIRTSSPTDQQVEDLAYNNRHRDRGAEYEAGVRERYMALRLRGEDSKQAAGQGGKVPLEIERERVPLEVMERRLEAEESARRASQMGPAAAVALSPMMGMNDLAEGVSGWISGRRPEPQPLAAEVDEVVGRSGLGTKIAAGIGRAAGQMALTAPVAGGLGGGAGAWTAAGALGAAAQAPEGQRLQAATESTVSMALTLGGTRLLQRFLPGPALLRIPVAGATAGTGVEVVIDVATGRQVSAEEFAEKAARNTVFSLNDIPAVYRAEVYQNLRRGVESRRADRAYTAAEQRAGMADPARPEAEAYREAMGAGAEQAPTSPVPEMARPDVPAFAPEVQVPAPEAPPAEPAKRAAPRPAPTPDEVRAQYDDRGADTDIGRRFVFHTSTSPDLEASGAKTGMRDALWVARDRPRGSEYGDTRYAIDTEMIPAGSLLEGKAAEAAGYPPNARVIVGPVPPEAIVKLGDTSGMGVADIHAQVAERVNARLAPPAEPAPSKGMATNPKRRGKGMARPKAPGAAMEEASKIKQEYIEQGGDLTHVMSPERVAAVERGEPLPPPEVRPDGSIAAGYDPQAREKGLIEPGALPAVDAAEAQGVAVVSSGTDAATGEGYAVGRAPSGEVVEVWAPAPDVAAPRLPEKSPLADTPAPADDPDLPAYLRNVTPAPRLKPEPKGGIGRGRMADPERGAAGGIGADDVKDLGRRVAGGVRSVAQGVGETARSLLGPRGELTRGYGITGSGDDLADVATEANIRSARFRAAITEEVETAQRAAQGSAHGIAGKGKRKAEAAVSAMRPVADPSGKFWDSRAREMVERGMAAETPEEGAIGTALQRLSGKAWNVQDDMGLTREIDGVDVPMGQIPDGMGKRLPYIDNALGLEIDRVGPNHPLWPSRMEAVKAKTARDYPDTPPEVVEERLLERHKQANERGIESLTRDMAAEHLRNVAFPDFIPDTKGKPVAIHEVNVHTYVTRFADHGSVTVGAQAATGGRGRASKIAELRKSMVDVDKVPGDRFDTAMRSIFGLDDSGSSRLNDHPSVQNAFGLLGRAYKGAATLIRGAARTASFAYQLPDVALGNQALLAGLDETFAGIGRTLMNAANVGIGRGRTEHMKGLIASGAKTPNVPNFSASEGQGKVALAAQNAGRVVHEVTAKVFDEMQESVGAGAVTSFGVKLLERAGKYSQFKRDRLALRTSAFTDTPVETVRRVLDGEGTPAEVTDFVRRLEDRATSRSTGSNVAPSQRSRVAVHPLTGAAFKFYRWFENNIGTTVRMHSAAAKTWESGGLRGKAAATTELARFWAFKAINGAAAQMLAAFVVPGYSDLDSEWRALKKNPAGYILGAGLLNAAGGSLTNMVIGQGDVWRNSLPASVIRLFVLTPGEAAINAIKGKENKAKRDLGKAAQGAMPLLRLDVGGKKDRRGSR